jgi:triacylglycerol lipase
MHHVFLIPGFFGFANFGDIKYFMHVREVLGLAFENRGERAEIHYVLTLPTASLPQRASAIADALAAVPHVEGDRVHLIGHSTGGLDARLFCSPGVTLSCEHDVDALAQRVDSVVSVATPHYGTPLASLFASLSGQRLLWVLSLLTMHGIRLGTMPLPALVALAGSLPRLGQLNYGRLQGPIMTILDQVYRQLLRDFDETRRTEINEFFVAASSDQNLIPQLGVESMQIFNAATTLRASTRYGCVVTQARPPSLRSTFALGFAPSSQAIYSLYRGLHEVAAGNARCEAPLSSAHKAQLRSVFGELPSLKSNDAIVPTRSQVWGELIHATWADHLDVIGHFDCPEHLPPHVDWLATQSKFSRSAFEALWGDVANFAVGKQAAAEPHGSR